MTYHNKKLERANELFQDIKKAEAELEALFGDIQQTRRGRPRKQNGAGDMGTVDGGAAHAGDAADH